MNIPYMSLVFTALTALKITGNILWSWWIIIFVPILIPVAILAAIAISGIILFLIAMMGVAIEWVTKERKKRYQGL